MNSIRQELYNPKDTFTSFSVDSLLRRWNNHHCVCSKLQISTEHMCETEENQHHCFTLDTSVFPPEIQEAVDQGLNHIPLVPVDSDVTMDVIHDLLQQYLDELLSRHLISSEENDLTIYCDSVRRYTLRYLPYPSGDIISKPFRQDTYQHMKHLKQGLYISDLDKAHNNVFVRCKDEARMVALNRLENSGDFQRIHRSVQDVAADLSTAISDMLPALCTSPATLPYLFTLRKHHKSKERFVVNAAAAALTPLGQLDQLCSKEIKEHFLHLAGERMQTLDRFTKHSCLLLPSIQDYRDVVFNSPPSITSDLTYDIENCYERIPLSDTDPDGLLTILNSIIDRVWTYYKRTNHNKEPNMIVRLHHETGEPLQATLTHTNPVWKRCVVLSKADLQAVQAMNITNAFVQLGDRLYRQICGIAMGAPPSPQHCDLYLSHYEMQMCENLYGSGDWTLINHADKLTHWYRLMDDLRVLNCPEFEAIIQRVGLYPKCLNLKSTTLAATDCIPRAIGATEYLDLRTDHYADGSYVFRRFRKEERLPFTPLKYIQKHSTRPGKAMINVFKAMLHTGLYHASSTQQFIKDYMTLYRNFRTNGFSHRELHRAALDFLQRNLHSKLVRFNVHSALVAIRKL
jgi:hypothetical protein